jgi:SAM-dependent methyltransferase
MNAHDLPFSTACLRNQGPILSVLRRWLPPARVDRPLEVLEVGSGTGQHAIHMARHLEGVHWHPSDRQENLPVLARRIALEGSEGLAPGARMAPPLLLEVTQPNWPEGPFSAVFSANTLHIMEAAAVPFLLAGSARVLAPGGLLLLYGPFRYGEGHTAASNAAFDAHLRGLDPAMGVRDAEVLTQEAVHWGLEPLADEAMPANNRLLVFRLGSAAPRQAMAEG